MIEDINDFDEKLETLVKIGMNPKGASLILELHELYGPRDMLLQLVTFFEEIDIDTKYDAAYTAVADGIQNLIDEHLSDEDQG